MASPTCLPALGDHLDDVVGQVIGGQRKGLAFAFLDIALDEEVGSAVDSDVFEDLAPETAIHIGDRGLDGELVLGGDEKIGPATADLGMQDVGDDDINFGIGGGVLVDLEGAVVVEAADDRVGDGHLDIRVQAGVAGDGNIDAAHALKVATGGIADAIAGAAVERQDADNDNGEPGQYGAGHCGKGVLSGGLATGSDTGRSGVSEVSPAAVAPGEELVTGSLGSTGGAPVGGGGGGG